MRDFSNWKEYEGASEGSGRSDKVWLISDMGEIGLFKFTKSDYTKEHISEKIASEIAQLIKIECAVIEIGCYNSREGCMSYLINTDEEILIEGINLINKIYPSYDPAELYDKEVQKYYSVYMIERALDAYSLINEFIKIMVFDFIIGNSDRHQNNWALLQNGDDVRLCPLYDNGSSLCCYICENDIDSYLGNDKIRFESLVNSKSRSRIRIDENIKKEPTHIEVLKHIKYQYKNANINAWIANTISSLTDERIHKLIFSYDEILLSKKRKVLIEKFLNRKIEILKEVFQGKED